MKTKTKPKTKAEKTMAKETTVAVPEWEPEVACRLVELYVSELTERRDKRILDIQGLVEAYLYVWGRLRAGREEMDRIVVAVKEDVKIRPEKPVESGLQDAIGKKKLSEGLLKALEGM